MPGGERGITWSSSWQHYIRPETAARLHELLGSESLEDASVWADEYRRDHRETGPWHYIDIPLADARIDLARECSNGQCVIAKTEEFIAVLKDPKADPATKVQALRFVIHFLGDLHQPLHDEDDGDKGGNARRSLLTAIPTTCIGCGIRVCWSTSTATSRNSRWSWKAKSPHKTGRSGPRGTIEDWMMEGHRLAQSVAYGDLSTQNRLPLALPTSRAEIPSSRLN